MEHLFQQSFPLSLILLFLTQWKWFVTYAYTPPLGMWNCMGHNEMKMKLTRTKDSETDLSWCNVTLVAITSQARRKTCKVQVHWGCSRQAWYCTEKDIRGPSRAAIASPSSDVFECLGQVSSSICVIWACWTVRENNLFSLWVPRSLAESSPIHLKHRENWCQPSEKRRQRNK